MILVLMGTFDIEFRRPLEEIRKLCLDGTINEEVIVQSGYTTIDAIRLMVVKPFIDPDELLELHKKARIIITHAGTGSLIKAITLKKKVIAVARLAKFSEHVDDHQLEILAEFEKLKYVLAWRENTSLKEVLERIDDFTPSEFVSNKPAIMNFLLDYIDSMK